MKDDSEKQMEAEKNIYIYTEWKNTKLQRKGLFLIEI